MFFLSSSLLHSSSSLFFTSLWTSHSWSDSLSMAFLLLSLAMSTACLLLFLLFLFDFCWFPACLAFCPLILDVDKNTPLSGQEEYLGCHSREGRQREASRDIWEWERDIQNKGQKEAVSRERKRRPQKTITIYFSQSSISSRPVCVSFISCVIHSVK